ncbi:MAG: hypothetical protein ACE5GI_08785, partial [Candidatus Aminicenantales bacterium]
MAVLAIIFTAEFMYSHISLSFGEDELKVPPPSYARYEKALTKAIMDIENQPVVKEVLSKSFEESGIGYAIESRTVYCFVSERNIKEVANYYGEQLGEQYEISSEPIMNPPEELAQIEKLSGLSWEKSFMESYQKAYAEYKGVESKQANFEVSEWPKAIVEIEIESPFLDQTIWKLNNKTLIMYTVTKL